MQRIFAANTTQVEDNNLQVVLVSAATGNFLSPHYKMGALFVDSNNIIFDQAISYETYLFRLRRMNLPHGSNVMHTNLLGQSLDSLKKMSSQPEQANQNFNSEIPKQSSEKSHSYDLRKSGGKTHTANEKPRNPSTAKSNEANVSPVKPIANSPTLSDKRLAAIISGGYIPEQIGHQNVALKSNITPTHLLNHPSTDFEKTNTVIELQKPIRIKKRKRNEEPAEENQGSEKRQKPNQQINVISPPVILNNNGYVFANMPEAIQIPADAKRYSVNFRFFRKPMKELQYIIIDGTKFPIIEKGPFSERLSRGTAARLGNEESNCLNYPKKVFPIIEAKTNARNANKDKKIKTNAENEERRRLQPQLDRVNYIIKQRDFHDLVKQDHFSILPHSMFLQFALPSPPVEEKEKHYAYFDKFN